MRSNEDDARKTRKAKKKRAHESKTVAVYEILWRNPQRDHGAIIIYLGNENWLPFNRYLPLARALNDTLSRES